MSAEVTPPVRQSAEAGDVQDAIDRIFAEYALLFAAQFRNAFPSEGHLQAAKRLWHGFFAQYDARILLQAAREAARQTQYLPTVHEVELQCSRQAGIPELERAWQEACDAVPPLELCQWSHPAVYHAARLSSRALQEERRGTALPVFRDHYERLCKRVLQGTVLGLPRVLPEPEQEVLSRDQASKRLADIRKKLGL